MRGRTLKEEVVTTAEGWTTTNLETFRFLVDHPPPRPYGYLDQIFIDCQAWRVYLFWVPGIAFLSLGFYYLSPWPTLVGVWALGSYTILLRSTVQGLRNGLLTTGVIRRLSKRHPLVKTCSIAKAKLDDDRIVTVTVPTEPAEQILAEHGAAEVLFPGDPRSNSSVAIGIRPVPTVIQTSESPARL